MVQDVTAVVAAASPNRGIGYQGQLPWRLPADLKHFQRVTQTPPQPHLTNAIVMGRKTWQSLPNGRPLKGRINVVLTTSNDVKFPAGVVRATDLQDAETQLAGMANLGHVFVIGGAQVYQATLQSDHLRVNRVIYTKVEATNDAALAKLNQCDVFFPELSQTEWEKKPYYETVKPQDKNDDNDKENDSNTPTSHGGVDAESGLRYSFWEYTRQINTEEVQYLQLCRTIVESGIRKGDRTGTGTLSQFGTQMRFNLRNDTLPLLTTKRVFWRGVAEELLWFISGNTNANDLAAKDIHIWDGNGSREFLDQRGLSHREVGDLGPVYGFQWRHFGAKYIDFNTDYTGQGVDQLAECIDKIKNHPEDRRIILSAWNPTDLSLMALPPCHMFCQFYVDTVNNEVSCQMYQRSADMGLGVPFNIASYALLTHMIAHVTGRKPGDLVHTIGDAHVYLNHVQALQEQVAREPRPFPKLKINPAKKNIDDFEFSDFEVIGYKPHKAIKMKMAV